MSIVWFRKCLRIHDNKSLITAIESKLPVMPIFILDPTFMKYGRCGINRWSFLFQTLENLNESLASLGSSLTVFRGNPIEIIEMLIKTKQIHNIYFERDTEPYAKYRDQKIAELCDIYKVNLQTFLGHTLYDHEEVIKLNKNITPLTYTKFLNLIHKMPDIEDCVRNPSKSEFLNFQVSKKFLASMNYTDMVSIPKLSEIVDKNNESLKISPTTNYIGGESEGLRIMNEYLKDRKKVINFLKPNTNPAHYDQKSTTTLSSYLKFGSVSIKRFYHELKKILKEEPRHSQPPCSLLGQIYWREFFYCGSVGIKNFHKMEDNIACKVVDWRSTEEEEGKKLLTAWTNAQTGYPWIDAIMTQLKQEGWIHHLARHSVACFLTRGDLYINWERGMEVFEELLLDADYALNAGNWLWLSGTSSYFTAYFRLYSPVAFPKKYDPNGDYVRHFLPVLKNMPKDYIYEPWKAPKSLQEKIGCVVGKNYPERIVIHEDVSKENLSSLKAVFGKGKGTSLDDAGMEPNESDDDESLKKKRSKSLKTNKKEGQTNNLSIKNFIKTKNKPEEEQDSKSDAISNKRLSKSVEKNISSYNSKEPKGKIFNEEIHTLLEKNNFNSKNNNIQIQENKSVKRRFSETEIKLEGEDEINKKKKNKKK